MAHSRNPAFAEQLLQELLPNAIVIGDSSKPGRIMDATTTGWKAAQLL